MTVQRAISTPMRAKRLRQATAALLLALVSGCGALQQSREPPPAFFSLDLPANVAAGTAAQAPATGATLIVNTPGAAAGFDSHRIIYVRKPFELEYFAQSQWIDPPARMLTPLIVAAIERAAAFRAVVHTPSSAAGEMRLDTEIVRLQHEFLQRPSRVHFTLRATVVDSTTRRPLATREFDAYAVAPSEDPYGGVIAANQAVASVLEELAAFCAGVKMPVR